MLACRKGHLLFSKHSYTGCTYNASHTQPFLAILENRLINRISLLSIHFDEDGAKGKYSAQKDYCPGLHKPTNTIGERTSK